MKEDFPQIELVFLNACFTETTAKAISESGIFTIGTTDEVHSTTAMAFAEGFYFQYAQAANKAPDRVLLAVKHGLRQVLLDYNEDANSLIHLYHNGRSISI